MDVLIKTVVKYDQLFLIICFELSEKNYFTIIIQFFVMTLDNILGDITFLR